MNIQNFPKITFILRGYTYEQVRQVVEILVETKFNSLEITLNSPDAFGTIKKINEEFGDKMFIGAGTVLTMEDTVKAVEAGAKFLLAPSMLSKEILQYCKEHEVISVPGAFTPTEIYQSIQDGADIVKVFPANTVGSKFFKDIQAPFGKLPLMAVGGVNSSNGQEYFDAGTSFVGIGSGIFNLDDLLNGEIEKIKEKLAELEQLL